ncbi:glutathione S-transferase [Mycena vulgaris]|nr:glutathione S-transferase [Mycena vulgaris]
MPEQITLYTSAGCPYAHRVELALAEAKVDFTRVEIDLGNKPEWYASKVNPASKVAYGGPQVPPDQPSPESIRLAESLILVEFVADLYPASALLPTDAVLRAKTRFIIDVVSTKFGPAFMAPLVRGESFAALWDVLEALQSLLPTDKPFAVALKNDIGAYKEGEGTKAAEYFFSGGRFARLVKYFDEIKARESFKTTFSAKGIKEKYGERFGPLRQQVQAAAAA